MTPLQTRIINNSYISDSLSDGVTPCWIWTGKRSARGDYGHINMHLNGKHTTLKAHKVSLHAFKGATLENDGRVIMHRCNNRLCVAPLHLQLGSQSENMQQCVADGRHKSQGDHGRSA